MVQSFEIINDTLGLGRVGRYLKFGSHMLRKFNANYLSQESIESNLLGMDLVDMLHCSGKN